MEKLEPKYLTEFKKLEAKLRKISKIGKDNVSFRDIVKEAKRINPVIEANEGLIEDLYGLRNVFAHADRDKYIADVNNFAFAELSRLINLLDNPPKVGDIFKREIYTADLHDILKDILKEMKEKIYTHVPIYDGGKFVGILSETTILEWLCENISDCGTAYFEKKRLKDINRKYLHTVINQHKFVKGETSIFEVQKMFDNAISDQERLGVVIITPSGQKNEKPIGIITAWDLPKIKEYYNSGAIK